MTKTILCLGDSLTKGYGSTETKFTYPSHLKEVLKSFGSYNIINAGVIGDTSIGALNRIDGLLRTYQPYLVITCIGTNDMLLNTNPAVTKSNIISICNKVSQFGARNLLLGVPNWFNGVPITVAVDHPMYAEIGQQLGIYVQTGGLALYESDSMWRFDNVHLNNFGYMGWSYYVGQAMNYGGLL
ncbi:GDSL-type esterase/lipase family protein [Entomomonas asaccharolytica]|uniref:SGNH hydrolase-type esterase domain-containing protein n=1 Tax=Entomomonas asaccharolytica TaxID=2785331 RepID=A0A974NF80_9GAMM|nr:GDSL-type esterase/lipase family protein [Entomomonas asaccharolytica]QQP85573.1 hypothetical protein JHT90_14570 [Entomomonas asaccharolytica]